MCVLEDIAMCCESLVMHRAPTPTPDNEPFDDEDPVPVPGVPAPDDEQVPDHNPTVIEKWVAGER